MVDSFPKATIRRLYLVLGAPVCLFFLLFISCTNSAPVISQTQASRIISYDAITKKTSQYLSVFCAIEDKDGVQDINSLYILSDGTKLLWHLEASSLHLKNLGNRTWYGNNHLVVPSGEAFPAGKVRVVVYDRAGNKAESEAGLPTPDHDVMDDIPRATRNQNGLTLRPTPKLDIMEREVAGRDWSQNEVSRMSVPVTNAPFDLLSPGRKGPEIKYFINDIYYDGSLLFISGPW